MRKTKKESSTKDSDVSRKTPYLKSSTISRLPSQTNYAKWFVLFKRFRSLSWKDRNFRKCVVSDSRCNGLVPK